MRYVINNNIALRSWQRSPYAAYRWGQREPMRLTPEEYGLLSLCDGEHDLEPSEALDALLARHLAHAAAPGEKPSAWSLPHTYPNRVFTSVNWSITGKCNLNCRHCFMASSNAPMMGEFSWEECLALLDEIEATGIQTVCITGGEPMLHPRFMDLMREVDRRHLTIGDLNTNGTMVTPQMLDEFREMGQPVYFKVSLDGIGHHDWLRQCPGAEEKALAAIELMCDHGFDIMVQMNVHAGNIDCALPTILRLDEIDVGCVRVIRTSESPRWVENGGAATLGVTEYYDAMLDLFAGCLEHGVRSDIIAWQVGRMHPRFRSYAFDPVQICEGCYKDSTPSCKGVRGLVAITHEGEIVPCNQMSGYFAAKGVSLGNVRRTPLRELLLGGDYLDAATLSVGQIREHNPECAACPYWRVCGGGCRALALALTGDYEARDPVKCAFFFGGYFGRMEALFAQAGWRCNSPAGDVPRGRNEERFARVLAELGPLA